MNKPTVIYSPTYSGPTIKLFFSDYYGGTQVIIGKEK